jgi:hypothetical protein
MVGRKGFEPPAPTHRISREIRGLFRAIQANLSSEKLFAINSSKRRPRQYTLLPGKMGATGFVTRTERTWISKSEDYPCGMPPSRPTV